MSGRQDAAQIRFPDYQISDSRNKSGAEPDVRVGVRTGVAAVQGADTGAGTVVPVATTPSKALSSVPHINIVSSMISAIRRE